MYGTIDVHKSSMRRVPRVVLKHVKDCLAHFFITRTSQVHTTKGILSYHADYEMLEDHALTREVLLSIRYDIESGAQIISRKVRTFLFHGRFSRTYH